MTIFTRKFSEFVPQNVDEGVGLTGGANSIGPTGGGGGGNGETLKRLIGQPNHMLSPGNWVTVDPLGNYVPALSDDPEDAEVAGVVTADQLTPNQFTLAVVGYIEDGVFTGLVPGQVYFLSNVTPGLMQLEPPTQNGLVNIPVFIAVTPTEGWIRQWRGIINGGQPSPQIGPGPSPNPNIVVIEQINHMLLPGQVVRLSGSITYVPAQANSLANSQAVGVVIQKIDVDHFVLQTEGYLVGAITQDSAMAALVPAAIYYLDPDTAGTITSTAPSTVGQVTKPIFACEQTAGALTVNAGYILPQRPLEVTAASTNPNIVTITQNGSAFSPGNWLYISGYDAVHLNPIYSLAVSTSLATSQVVGVVISAVGDTFVLQTEGYNVGAVTEDDVPNPVTNSTVYYLSSTDAGAITSVMPASVGLYSKPVYICEQSAANNGVYAGYIIPQRPLPYDMASNPSIVTVTQANGFALGDVVRLNTSGMYVLAQADNLADAQAIGVIIDLPVPGSVFVLQTEGITTDSLTEDENGNPLAVGVPYYLSAVNPGLVTAVAPSGLGQVTKPIFIPATASPGHATGYILPQRPLENTSETVNPNIVTVNQPGWMSAPYNLSVGLWVYISGYVGATPIYRAGAATSLATSQVVGVIIENVDVNHFVLQTEGYNVGAVTTDDLGNPIIQSNIYYLSYLIPGKITNIFPSIVGNYVKPLYASEQTTASTGINAGYILEQVPLSVDESDNPNIVFITQANHGLNLGDVVRLSGNITYIRALADNLPDAQAVGVCINPLDNQSFILQTEGYSVGAILKDASLANLVPASVYYLSATVPGRVTSTPPAAVGQATKPMFICEQAGASPAGYILPQRPLLNTASAMNVNLVTVTQPSWQSTLFVGAWVYVSGFSGANPTYSLGVATSLAKSQVVGVIVQSISTSQFVLQTEGYNVGAVTQNDALGAIVQSNTYYLSATRAGYITSTAPSATGQYTKPLYISEQTAASTGTNAGYILPQRPLAVSGGGGGGGGGYQLIQNFPLTNAASIPIAGIFGGYKDIRIVGESIVFKTLAGGGLSALGFQMQLQLGGTLKTDAQYVYVTGAGSTTGQKAVSAILMTGLATPTFDTTGGCSYAFVAEILEVNSSSLFSTATINTVQYPKGVPTLTNNAVATTTNVTGMYFASTAACTGVTFNFASPGLYVIQSGLISVYGVPI